MDIKEGGTGGKRGQKGFSRAEAEWWAELMVDGVRVKV